MFKIRRVCEKLFFFFFKRELLCVVDERERESVCVCVNASHIINEEREGFMNEEEGECFVYTWDA